MGQVFLNPLDTPVLWDATQKNGRSALLDGVKGFAILLVVFGHSIQSAFPNFDNSLVFSVIYSFHMPLFMFVSGFLALHRIENVNLSFFKRKIQQLVVPFASWYLIGYGILILRDSLNHSHLSIPINFGEYIFRLIINPDWGLWFLWVLFLNFVVIAVALKYERYFGILVIPLAIVIINLIPVGSCGIGLLKWHLLFFSAGYLVSRYRNLLTAQSHLLFSFSALFPLYAFYWKRIWSDEYHHVITMIPTLEKWGVLTIALIKIYNYTIPFVGIIFSFLLIEKIQRFVSVFNPICWLGTVTLDIYVSHQLFLRLGLGEGYLYIVSSGLIALFLSLLLSFGVLRRSSFLKRILLGMKS
ncbi:acyltransferase family protein [Methanosphaerula subterraneus]|uniref:acyltransferase family protein n=1 Tax=Methanosphaerula subterraneus TaxID=3350244 RepID=UPI003F82B2F1